MWRHRSDGGARRLGFRLGGGVQRRLGVWRCSAGWGGGAARRTARVSRGVWRWQQFFTATHDVAEFGFFYRFTSLQLTTSRNLAFFPVLLHCNSRRRGIWLFSPFYSTATHDVAEFGFFLPLPHCNSRFRDVLSCSEVTGEENQIPRRRELQYSKRGGRREFKRTHIQSSLAELRASSYFEVPHVQRYGAPGRNTATPHEATTRTVSTSRPRHHVFVSRSCPEANYKWSPQARHDDETRTTCV